jgi:hypothetical protein
LHGVIWNGLGLGGMLGGETSSSSASSTIARGLHGLGRRMLRPEEAHLLPGSTEERGTRKGIVSR